MDERDYKAMNEELNPSPYLGDLNLAMEKRPLRKDFQKEFPNVGFNSTAYHEALEKWAEKAEAKLKELQRYKDTTLGMLDAFMQTINQI